MRVAYPLVETSLAAWGSWRTVQRVVERSLIPNDLVAARPQIRTYGAVGEGPVIRTDCTHLSRLERYCLS